MDATNPQIVFGNIELVSGIQQDGANPYTIGDALGIAGLLYPLTFGGAATATVNPSSFATSDALAGVTLRAGQVVYLRAYLSVATAGQKYPKTGATTCNQPWTEGMVNIQNLPVSGSAAITAADSTEGTFPLSFLGHVAPQAGIAVASIGDSIVEVHPIVSGARSLVAQAASRTVPSPTRTLRGSTSPTAGQHSTNSIRWRNEGTVRDACTHVVGDCGVKDFYSGISLPQMQSNAISLWSYVGDR